MKRATRSTETPQVGRSVPRLESWLKVTGKAEYVHNLRLPGMLYGKIFRSTVAHVDLYRHEDDLPHPDWLAEILDGDRVAVVEWFERLGASAPPDVLRIEVAYGAGEDARTFDVAATGPRARRVLDALVREHATGVAA